jgi:hypothetical protein
MASWGSTSCEANTETRLRAGTFAAERTFVTDSTGSMTVALDPGGVTGRQSAKTASQCIEFDKPNRPLEAWGMMMVE